MTKTLTGPNGIRILLDSEQIIPNDPGAGTPAIVYVGHYQSTYWCALDTGELCSGDRDYTLDNVQYRWLDDQFDKVSAFVEAHSE